MIPAIILCLAFLIDVTAGDPPNALHPVAWMGGYIKRFWDLRPESGGLRLFLYGMLISLSGVIVFTLPVLSVEMLPPLFSLLLSALLLKLSFSTKKLFRAAGGIADILEQDDLEEARKQTSFHLVSRPTASLSRENIAGAVIESVSENLTDSFTSPLLYFSLLGLPFAWGYRYINTCDAMLGYREGDFEQGGKFAARLDDALNFVPARLTAFFILLTGIPSGRNFFSLFAQTIRWQKQTASPNAGWTMAAMAAVLDIKLEKEGHYVLNENGREPSADDIRECLLRGRVTSAMILVLVILLVIFLHG